MTITIELLAAAHAAALLRLAKDPRLSATSSLPLDCGRAHVDGWIAENQREPATTLTFAILADGSVVGAVTLKRLDASDHSGELSYWIGTEHQRKGYATAAARLAVEYAPFAAPRPHPRALPEGSQPSVRQGLARRLRFRARSRPR